MYRIKKNNTTSHTGIIETTNPYLLLIKNGIIPQTKQTKGKLNKVLDTAWASQLFCACGLSILMAPAIRHGINPKIANTKFMILKIVNTDFI